MVARWPLAFLLASAAAASPEVRSPETAGEAPPAEASAQQKRRQQRSHTEQREQREQREQKEQSEQGHFDAYMKSYLPPGDFKAYASKFTGENAGWKKYMDKYEGGRASKYNEFIEKYGGTLANYPEYVSTYAAMAGPAPSSGNDWKEKQGQQLHAWNASMTSTYQHYIPQSYQHFAQGATKVRMQQGGGGGEAPAEAKPSEATEPHKSPEAAKSHKSSGAAKSSNKQDSAAALRVKRLRDELKRQEAAAKKAAREESTPAPAQAALLISSDPQDSAEKPKQESWEEHLAKERAHEEKRVRREVDHVKAEVDKELEGERGRLRHEADAESKRLRQQWKEEEQAAAAAARPTAGEGLSTAPGTAAPVVTVLLAFLAASALGFAGAALWPGRARRVGDAAVREGLLG